MKKVEDFFNETTKTIEETKKIEDFFNEAMETMKEAEIIAPNYHSGSKEDPNPIFVSFAVYNAFVKEGIVEEGDLVYSKYNGWCKLIYQKPLPEGEYFFNANGKITHITESVNAAQKKNKESMDKFLNNKYKKRRY